MQIKEFQEMMRKLYYHKDSKRGFEKTFEWLVEEVAELGEALTSNREALESEFADVIAWLASLANVMNVDLEKVTITKYAYKCPKCGKAPCQCPI
ncbi:nucleotide pyrophosphohydrolase [Candidatus Bathyarchaeota archaeon]|nr:nucleotide pyrophosphohydrolase [Candidatus Bathyarchaeota archaeon]